MGGDLICETDGDACRGSAARLETRGCPTDVTDGDSHPIGYKEDLPVPTVRAEEHPGLEALAGVLARAGTEGLPRAEIGTETVPDRLASADMILSAERALVTGRCILPVRLIRLPDRVVRLAGASTLAVVI